MKRSKKSKTKEPQKINIDTNKDGMCSVPDAFIEDYKKVYYYIEDNGKILFPFIYLTSIGEPLNQKCTILIKKNELIKVEDDKKHLISF